MYHFCFTFWEGKHFPLRKVVASGFDSKGLECHGEGGGDAGWSLATEPPQRACGASAFRRIFCSLVCFAGNLGFAVELLLRNVDQRCFCLSLVRFSEFIYSLLLDHISLPRTNASLSSDWQYSCVSVPCLILFSSALKAPSHMHWHPLVCLVPEASQHLFCCIPKAWDFDLFCCTC